MEGFIYSLLLLGLGGLAGLPLKRGSKFGRQTIRDAMLGISFMFIVLTAYRIGELVIILSDSDTITAISKGGKFIRDKGGYIPLYILVMAVLGYLYYFSNKIDKVDSKTDKE